MATARAAKPVGATRAPAKTSAAKKSSAKKSAKPKSATASKQQFAATQHGAVERDADLPPATCIALVERITRAVERELSQIEAIVGGHHVEPALRAEAERRARTRRRSHTLTEVRKMVRAPRIRML
jgi:hypothetical protein